MLAIGLVHWFIWPNNPENYSSTDYKWKVESYLASFLLGYFIFGTLITCKSFPGLENHYSTISYLSLPASAFEKFLAQWILRLLLFAIFYPIIFKLSVNLTIWLYKGVNSEYFDSVVPGVSGIEIEYFSFFAMFPNPYFEKGIFGIVAMGMTGLSYLFMTGTLFGKWNIIKGPLSAILLYFTYVFLILLIFRILNSVEGGVWNGMTNYKHPKIPLFNSEIPLTELGGAIVLICFPIICWIIAYFRLKEKEV
ncbi:hypothetical protein [Echinicola shivajiensis]|uniref:hypothetical protein n=1 Tax=Echinicola shivajiensis TaxID=1035916 RepID=UPI001BFC5685|nr:hypothetical protein [Echinicola shivajiensis]